MRYKKVIIWLVAILILGFTGCKEENPTHERKSTSASKINAIKEGIEVAKTVPKAGDYTETLKYHRERLRKEEPVDVQILKEWYPETLGNLTIEKITEGRSGFKNTSVANAFYTNNKGGSEIQRLKIELLDGAGEQGSMVSSNMLAEGVFKRDASTSNFINKWSDRNGMDILETHDSRTNSTTLTFVVHERFSILVRAQNMDIEATWNLISKLPFKKLPKS